MNNKTSDKNVANIEDDIKVLNELLENVELTFGGWVDILNEREKEALRNILAELEQMLKEREKYTIRLTDEEYRKVIDIAQKDIAEQKDKRIKELEEALLKVKDKNATLFITCRNSIAKEKVINVIQEYKDKVEQYNEYREQGKETDVEYYENIANTIVVQVLQELLEGESK